MTTADSVANCPMWQKLIRLILSSNNLFTNTQIYTLDNERRVFDDLCPSNVTDSLFHPIKPCSIIIQKAFLSLPTPFFFKYEKLDTQKNDEFLYTLGSWNLSEIWTFLIFFGCILG